MGIETILSEIAALSDKERGALMDKIEETWCVHCGVEQEGKPMGCQCSNDE